MDIRVLLDPRNSIINLDFGYLRQVEDTKADCDFIVSLFSVDDVRKYFVLDDKYSRDIRLFHKYLAEMRLNYIYENKSHEPMGLFLCDIRDAGHGDLQGFVSYALLPAYRGRNYTESALAAFCTMLRGSQLSYLVLEISVSNVASTRIAQKLGFSNLSPNGLKEAWFDRKWPGFVRFRWYYGLHQEVSEREKLCRQAMAAFDERDYKQSIVLFNQALTKECPRTCQFNDAQILANVAMAHSTIGNYQVAYKFLIRAYNAGVRNESVIKEINRLRKNAPWACV